MASGHDKTWDSQTVGEKIRNFFQTFWVWSDKSIYLFAISNILCLAQQLLNTTLVSGLPCFPFISSRRRPLVLVGEAGSEWDSPILIIACVSPEQQHLCVWLCDVSVCFCFYLSWHCEEAPGLSDSQPSVSVTVSLCIRISFRMGTVAWKHRPING